MKEFDKNYKNKGYLIKIKEKVKNSFENYQHNYFYCTSFLNVADNKKENISETYLDDNFKEKEALTKEINDLKNKIKKYEMELKELKQKKNNHLPHNNKKSD